MAHPIQIPRLGWSMEEGVFVEWLRADGDTIEPGDVLFNLEGEKAIQEIESIDAGVLRIPANAPAEGDTVLVGQVIGWLCAEDEDTPAEFPAVASAAAMNCARRADSGLTSGSGAGASASGSGAGTGAGGFFLPFPDAS